METRQIQKAVCMAFLSTATLAEALEENVEDKELERHQCDGR